MSTNKPRFFFTATQSVSDRIGELFSFTWASYAGLRELWWQARGFSAQFPALSIKDVEAKFLSVPKMPGGVDMKKMILDRDWLYHEREFSKSLIFGGCTLYESWAESVCRDIFNAPAAAKHSKSIQFPINHNKSQPNGFKAVVAAANANQSVLIKGNIFPTVCAASSNCWGTANEHLTAYRYFKECRNAMIHSSGLVNNDVLSAHQQLQNLHGINPPPFRHGFAIPAPQPGEPIPLDLRDATLFVTVVRRLIHTFDAALCVSTASESILNSRVENVRATSSKWKTFPADPASYRKRVHRLLSASMIPDPVNIDQVADWLKGKGTI
ncbi:hypothetical protein [uncultured Xanthomonas sp.]|uniref:hypothetical protein n=1 Tax=uncultured Xanthomonas sp. TaxID=152831 RepID=UPI0025EAB069|nr:hypothetical protein [uncultured Xanthomonas sp.]